MCFCYLLYLQFVSKDGRHLECNRRFTVQGNIVKTGLEISEYSQEKIKTSEIELVEERMNAMEILYQ